MTKQEYETQERLLFHRERRALENQIQPDKVYAMQNYRELMLTPECLDIAVDNLLCGNYGAGPMLAALDIIENKRINRCAAIGAIVAAVDCRCPADKARQAWKSLTGRERKAADFAVMDAIDVHITQQQEGIQWNSH
jgi:hypothetical protein